MDNKAWQVAHTERMSNAEEERILETPDRLEEKSYALLKSSISALAWTK
jgi:hypothetical protein